MKKSFLLIVASVVLAACSSLNNTATKPVDIQFIRNATLKINHNGKTFLVDPSLSAKNSFMSFVIPNKNLNPTVDLPLPIKQITNGLDAILVTHTHLDHFDTAAKKYINPNIPLFGQPFDKGVFEKSPFKNVSLIENKEEFKGTTIIRTNGKHGPDHMLKALGKVSGFVLKAKSYPTIYIVGDCLFDNEIKNNIKKYNPDIIIVNSGGAVFGGETILMDEKKAIELAKFTPKAKIIAVHMEALDHCKTTREIIRKEAKKAQVDIIVPNDGDFIKL